LEPKSQNHPCVCDYGRKWHHFTLCLYKHWLGIQSMIRR
jgi:hypothetical protein